MALTPITLTNLPGADRRFNIPLNAGPTPYVTRSWEADTIDEDIKHSGLKGAVSVVKKRKRRTITLKNVILDRANRRLIEELIDSGDHICVSPPWKDGTDVLTYLSLQKTLSDSREERTRSEVDFERLSARFNSVTGRKTLFGDPHWEDAPRGQGLSVSDVINDHHEPSYELRSYLTTDAEDSGATTLIYVSPAQAVLWDNYGSAVWPAGNKAFLMISNEEESTNAHESALISAINTTTGLVALVVPAGGAALGGTANYTYDKRTYISSVLVSDCEMEDSGLGSWADSGAAPTLAEKSETQRETGSRCLRIISSAADSGKEQVLGSFPAGTDLAIMVRAKAIMASGASDFKIIVWNNTDGVSVLSETIAVADALWNDYKYAFRIDAGATDPSEIELRLVGAVAAPDEFLIDRIYIFQNSVDNGGMEPLSGDTYDMELAVITTSAAATTTYAGLVVSDAAAWNLANAKVGHIAKEEVTGVYGRISNVNDAGDQVTVDAWVGGAPVNGNACGVYNAVAPGWSQTGCEAGDYLEQDTDEHGGGYAQKITADAAFEGIISDASVFTIGHWYFVGAYPKVSSGTVKIVTQSGDNLITGITSASFGTYALASAIWLADATEKIIISSTGGAAAWLTDDVMAIRLPGNPYDDGYYDLPGPLAGTTRVSFTMFGMWTPEAANTALTVDAYIFDISRRTHDSNNRTSLHYDQANNRFEFQLTFGGGVVTASRADTFSAGDSIYWAVNVNGLAGAQDMKLWIKKNALATNTGTAVNATTPSAMTRLWLRLGSGYTNPPRGAVAGIFIDQAEDGVDITDAQIEAIIDAFSGASAPELSLLEETHGILYEIRRGGVRVRGPAKGDEFRADIVLTELDRIGEFQTRDA